MAGIGARSPRQSLLWRWIGTLAIVGVYAAVMVCTNSRFTILDDESTIVTYAGNQPLFILHDFISGNPANEHPPLSDILLHFWLSATGHSFFMLRVFANVFFIAAIVLIALSSRRISGERAYWITLVLGFVWPFAFQFGRITGWYCFCMFLVAWLIWAYLRILDDDGNRFWAFFCSGGVLLVWSNYFAVALLLLFAADMAVLHRQIFVSRLRSILVVAAVVTVSELPLLNIALNNVQNTVQPISSVIDLKYAVASFSFPIFSVFGSVAVAPWYLPLSIPVLVGTLVLLVSIWQGPGRRWLVFFILAILLLALSGHVNVKRVLFLLPPLFLAMGIAITSGAALYRRLATAAMLLLVATGWVGIASGSHYGTSNLYEPWSKVAHIVANDARGGATIISENFPFFFYLDYQLNLQSVIQGQRGPYLGEAIYRAHGYTVLQPDNWQRWVGALHGKVVMVNGSGVLEQVEEQNALDAALRLRCKDVGEFHAAPDPAAEWKARYIAGAPLLAYRTKVTWYDCPR